ncbi:NusG domain II-containing protein [bacterium]|nr:NusG domain II-containing protein [bacterium]
MRKYRNDIILIAVMVFLAGLGLILYFCLQKKENLKVYIYSDKALIEVVDISESREIVVNGVVIVIDQNCVYVKHSSCRDQICVHQGKITSSGQTITCLPQRVFVQIEGSEVDVEL